jgi:diguanylate cyclase (GGDEF)-like protein
MDQDLEKYADSVYESARKESARIALQAQAEVVQARRLQGSTLPLSGVDISAILKVFDDHIGRCVLARFESYRIAYTESGRTPTEHDLSDILSECRTVRVQEIGHSAAAVNQFINSRAMVGLPGLDVQGTLDSNSAHDYDRVLEKLKVWKAKTQLKAAPAEVQSPEKQRDALTSTYNKAEFDLDLATLAAESTEDCPASLLFMDLDKFKSINDGPGGHEAGNRALQAFAASLLQVCNGKGTVYRWGGDELCVLLPNHSIDEATAVAERVRQAVRAIRTDELQDGLNTSIGVACFPESTPDPSRLVSQADKAMYASKEAGGNLVSKALTCAAPAANRQTPTQRVLLTEVISELEDNLERARAPIIGDAYRRPSSQVWKNSRNKIGLLDPLHYDVVQIYREIEDWLTVVESGVHPNMGSPALNNITASLATRLPSLIAELKKLL